MHTVIVHVLEATNMKETELLGRQDPYVEVRSNLEMKSTRVRYEAGKNASWKEEFRLKTRDLYGIIDFKIMNRNVLKDVVIGTCCMNLTQVVSAGGYMDSYLSIMTNGKNRGTLHVIVSIPEIIERNRSAIPTASAVYPPPAAAAYPPPPQGTYSPPAAAAYPPPPPGTYPPPAAAAYPPPPQGTYPPPPQATYPTAAPAYPPPPAAYPPPPPGAYPPPAIYPPPVTAYPTNPTTYPPPAPAGYPRPGYPY